MKKVLLKLGGRSLEGEEGYASLGRAIRKLHNCKVAIVHGGGAEISAALKATQREPVFVDGLRVTPPRDMAIVEQVLSQTVNQRIAGFLKAQGLAVQRLSGKSDCMLMVVPLVRNGQSLGRVGEVVDVNPEPVRQAWLHDYVPVISPVSTDAYGQSFNVNADSAAGALAGRLQCEDLIYFTDVPGVQANGEVLSDISVAAAEKLISDGVISGGMVAKMESAFAAITAGVGRVHITNWQGDDTLIQLLERAQAPGTAVHK